MSEQTNTNMPQSDGLDDFAKILDDFNKGEFDLKKSGSNRKSKEEILKKYFVPKAKEEMFRILPPKNGGDFVDRDGVFFHRLQVNDTATKKKWRYLYCEEANNDMHPKLDSNGEKILDQQGKPVMEKAVCPICAKSRAILKTQKNQDKLKASDGSWLSEDKMNDEQLAISKSNKEIFKKAMAYSPDKYYIIRGIDKGNPKDGVKFWRFKHKKKQPVLDQVMNAVKYFFKEYNQIPYDIEKGTDLYIQTSIDKTPSGRDYTVITSITARPPSRLYHDDLVMKEWLNDKTTWRDIFKPVTMTKVLTSYEYYKRIAMGTDPYWDSVEKRFIFPDPSDAELQEKANTRTDSLDDGANVEYRQSMDNRSINDVTKDDVGEFKETAQNITSQYKREETTATNQQSESDYSEDFDDDYGDDHDDLPF